MPKAAPLSALFVARIKAPSSGQIDYPDGATPGLFLRVSTGRAGEGPKKVWAMRLRTPRGTQERHTLGTLDDKQGLAWARNEAAALRHRVQREGLDPRAERKAIKVAHEAKQEKDRLTLGVLVGDWRRIRLQRQTEKYAAEAERALKHAFGKVWDKPAADLDKKQVANALADASSAMANRTCVYGRAAFRWAVDQGKVPANPFLGHVIDPLAKRERVLTDQELAEVWHAAEGEGSFGSIVRMLILTGQRREEVAGMAWNEISEDRTTWTIPGARTKNGNPSLVPLSDIARALLPADRAAGLVFPGEGSNDPNSKRLPVFCGWSRAKGRLDSAIAKQRSELAKAAGIEPQPAVGWRLHDLRRTCATGLQRLGTPIHVTEAILNHTSGSFRGVAGIYQRYDYQDEKRTALDGWAEHVQKLLEPKT